MGTFVLVNSRNDISFNDQKGEDGHHHDHHIHGPLDRSKAQCHDFNRLFVSDRETTEVGDMDRQALGIGSLSFEQLPFN